MDLDPQKVTGCLTGMTIGDAMGRGVNGLKPEAIRQIFGVIDDYKEVHNVVGKGIKNYRMQGLYGAPVQCALAVCDGILTNKKKFLEETVEIFQKLAKGGPENYYGTFRSSENCLWKAVDLMGDRSLAEPTPLNSATGLFAFLSTPLALFYKKWSKTLAEHCLQLTLAFSSHPLEVVGTMLNGFLVTRFLAMEESELISQRKIILEEAEEICLQAESEYQKRLNIFECETIEKYKNAFSNTIQNLIVQIEKPEKEVLQWIVENANGFSNREIRHASQGFVLSLFPLALYWVLNCENGFSLVPILSQGRETEKLGGLLGAWIGAIKGTEAIPENLKTHLVNGNEIRLRGEALYLRKMKKDSKPLVEMEMALTIKEAEEAKRYQPKEKKKSVKTVITLDYLEEEQDIVPPKEDRAEWRKFQKEKTKSKRNRRKNIPNDLF
tara:strand:+ start:2259 stop:3572 length:1314 start_codon:yes stop_codon:yes gene_type:complete